MAVNVVTLGGSFGGLTVAYELRRHLGPEKASITLVSKEPRFTFVPSLPWVAMGSRNLKQISFDLAAPLARKQVAFANETVLHIDPDKKSVTTDGAEHRCDFLVIATGHRSANETVEGLGPFDGPGHSLMSAPEAEELRTAIKRLVDDPGPVVVGAAPGASCIGPAYEFAFELDHLLRGRKLRHRVPITFVTPEPFLGHMGMGGAGKVRQLLEGAFDERDITYRTNAAVTKITADAVEAAGATSVPSVLSLVIPPLARVTAVAARIGGGEGTTAELGARCILDMGDRGVYMTVDPVRPPRDRIPTVSVGRRWLLAKRAFERTYLSCARHGMRVPTALGW